MREWRTWEYIKTWYKLTPSQRHTLRLMARAKRLKHWKQQREAYWWARLRDDLLYVLLMWVLPTAIVLWIIWEIGRKVGH